MCFCERACTAVPQVSLPIVNPGRQSETDPGPVAHLRFIVIVSVRLCVCVCLSA